MLRRLSFVYAFVTLVGIAFIFSNPSIREAVAQATVFTLGDGTTVQGHLLAAQPSLNGAAAAPPVAGGVSCGTPVLSAGSTDMAGMMQAKGISTCKITFGKAYAVAPFCTVVDMTTASTYTAATTTTAFVMGTTVSNDFIAWTCIGQPGN